MRQQVIPRIERIRRTEHTRNKIRQSLQSRGSNSPGVENPWQQNPDNRLALASNTRLEPENPTILR